MKKYLLVLLAFLSVNALCAQMVVREELHVNEKIKDYKVGNTSYFLEASPCLKTSFVENNDELLSFCWMRARGQFYYGLTSEIRDKQVANTNQYKQIKKECYHQILTDGIIINYFVESYTDKFVISYEERRMMDMALIRDEVIKEIPIDRVIKRKRVQDDMYRYELISASSPDDRYFALLINCVYEVGRPRRSIPVGSSVFRIDALKHSIENLYYETEKSNDEVFFISNNTKLLVNNEGNVAVVADRLKVDHKLAAKVDKYNESRTKASNALVQSIIKAYYIKINYFPLHGSSLENTQTFSKYLPNNFDITFTKDDKILIYGFAGLYLTGHTDKMFTLFYNCEQDLFTVPQIAQINGLTDDMMIVGIKPTGDGVDLNDLNLKPIGITQLNDGTYVMFAHWNVNITIHSDFLKDRASMSFNKLHFVINEDGSMRHQGIHFCSFPQSYTSNIHCQAHSSVKTDGNKAVLFTQVMNPCRDNDGSERFLRYSKHLSIQVITVDKDNKTRSEYMDENYKWRFSNEIMYGDPYYDEISDSWFLYILSKKACKLERWIIH